MGVTVMPRSRSPQYAARSHPVALRGAAFAARRGAKRRRAVCNLVYKTLHHVRRLLAQHAFRVAQAGRCCASTCPWLRLWVGECSRLPSLPSFFFKSDMRSFNLIDGRAGSGRSCNGEQQPGAQQQRPAQHVNKVVSRPINSRNTYCDGYTHLCGGCYAPRKHEQIGFMRWRASGHYQRHQRVTSRSRKLQQLGKSATMTL